MLNIFRRRDLVIRLFVGAILVMVSLAMVITLIPGMIGTPTDPASVQVVAEVGGERITTFELQQNVVQLARTNRIPSEMMWLYTQQVLDQMVLEKATMQEAQRLGLRVSDEDVRMRLRQSPDLFPEGKFVGRQQYEDLVFNRFGVSVEQFEERFRNSLLTEKLQRLVSDSVAVSPGEIRDAFVRQNEKFVLRYVLIEPASLRGSIRPTDAALEEYFQQNRDRYQLPEKRTARVLLLENEKVRQGMSVSEAERRAYYQDHLDDYRQQERVQVSHILFRLTDKEPAKVAEARKKAEDLLQQLKGGADFAELAKKHSEDAANASQGGDLGWILRGQTVPEFERAAFSLAPGSLSDPVQTDFGIHLIKVAAHEPSRLRPLEEVQAEIDNLLLDQKVQTTLANTVEQVAADWRRSPNEPQALAERYHGTVLEPPPLARGEPLPGLPGSEAVTEDIFILEKNQIGRPVPIPSGYAIPLLVDISPARPAEFGEVSDRVRTEYIDDQARGRAQAQALELAQLTERDAQRDLGRAARALGLTVKTSEPVTRAGTIPGVGSVRELGPRLDALQPGEVAGPVPAAGGQIVYQLESREPPKEEDFAAQKENFRLALLSEKQNMVFDIFQENLKSRLAESGELRINEEVLAQMSVGLPQ